MADLTFEEIIQAAHKLTPAQREALIRSLQPANRIPAPEHGLAKSSESLRDKYARPGVDISDESLNAYLHEIGKTWEQELDDLIDD